MSDQTSDNLNDRQTESGSSLSSDPPAKRGPGRPPGSKKRPYELVVVNDLQCPACKRTVTKVLESPYRPATLNYEHVAEDGFVYNRVIWQNRQCECGQFIRVKKRQYV
jgi:hypothetical protein